ncbi:MAG: flagellar brake protein [Thermodesulfobacteriota bacterium]
MEGVGETIRGSEMMDYLRELVARRRMCRMEIRNTPHSWITLLLSLQEIDGSYYLWIDRAKGCEKILARYPEREVSLEFLEIDGVPCRFQTRIVGFEPEGLRAELPGSIFRLQRRGFVRITARSGAEVVLHLEQGDKKAMLKDYGLGGISFLSDEPLPLRIGDSVDQLELRIPRGAGGIHFLIPRALVKRMERHPSGKDLWALEFTEMTESTQQRMWHHVFEEQRLLLQKTKKS